ncbi:MAG: hypothetical protein R3C11_19120 [Planctomycetaceae bacterium]
MLYGDPITLKLKKLQQKYLNSSRELLLSEWNQRSRSSRILQNVMRLFSPLL